MFGFDIWQLFLLDIMSVVLCRSRGRARSCEVLVAIRRIYSYCLAREIMPYLRWIPSELNSSDEPSRVLGYAPSTEHLRFEPAAFSAQEQRSCQPAAEYAWHEMPETSEEQALSRSRKEPWAGLRQARPGGWSCEGSGKGCHGAAGGFAAEAGGEGERPPEAAVADRLPGIGEAGEDAIALLRAASWPRGVEAEDSSGEHELTRGGQAAGVAEPQTATELVGATQLLQRAVGGVC